MPALPTFDPQGRPGEAAKIASDTTQSWMKLRQDQEMNRQIMEQRQQEIVQNEILRPVLEVKAQADLVKAKSDFDGAIKTQEMRKSAYDLLDQASSDFDFLNLVPDAKVRANLSREWLSRYSQLANIAELKGQVSQWNHLATSNILDEQKLKILGGVGKEMFDAMTAGMTPEERKSAAQVKLGLKGRQSGVSNQSLKVTLPDGKEATMVFDRGTGKYAIPQVESASGGPAASPEADNPFVGQTTEEKARTGEAGKQAADYQAKLKQERPKREKALRQAGISSDRLSSDIDELIGKVTASTAGPGGVVLDKFPGTSARDLQSNLDSIKANLGFQTLQAMRDASPTGGALGQVSDIENKLLQSTLASLEIGQSPKQLISNLKKAKQRVIENYGINRAAFHSQYGEAVDEPSAAWDESKESRLLELKAKLGQ